MGYHQLTELVANQPIVFGGDRVVYVSADLAASFRSGDRLLVDDDGTLLHIAAEDFLAASRSVDRAIAAFDELATVSDDQISDFFERFADALADDQHFAPVQAANADDIERAAERGRSTTRLALTPAMRSDMIAGLRGWAGAAAPRHRLVDAVTHDGWSVEAWRAPLGVIGFVFEGRPNVFADAAGVLRTGNTVVFRIGSDALHTARAIVEHALAPALAASGLPPGAVALVPSAAHAAGWALFSDPRLALAVARGSGRAVAQLGAIARQAGNAVSLHGTGGAWLFADEHSDLSWLAASVASSLDRKVCNTLNTVVVTAERATKVLAAVVGAARRAGADLGTDARLHATPRAWEHLDPSVRDAQVEVVRATGRSVEPLVSTIDADRLGEEWEWEQTPEVSLHVVDSIDDGIDAFNRLSPRFVATFITADQAAADRFYERIDAPFVGNAFTRWVDGQYALNAPELGLSNWEFGRMLGRGGVLSGDSVFTVRYRATVDDPMLRR